eukprot:2338-Heterococcus_DN1.PRE.4
MVFTCQCYILKRARALRRTTHNKFKCEKLCFIPVSQERVPQSAIAEEPAKKTCEHCCKGKCTNFGRFILQFTALSFLEMR